MPYIRQDRRLGAEHIPQNAGELNYAITKLLCGYIRSKGESYSTFNECIGALECAKLELYRRLVVPYERGKMLEHGDVYEHGE